MTEMLTAAQMRAVEQAAIESGDVTGLELMERAGAGVVDAIFKAWPDLGQGPQTAMVLCGPGNNGGDGYVIARLLKDLGWRLDVFRYGSAAGLPPDARYMHDRWCALGPVAALTEGNLMRALDQIGDRAQACVPVIDALFGIGQRAPMDDVLAPVHAMLNAWFDGQGGSAAPLFVAVDIPTGFDADTGQSLAKRPLPADLAVTFHRQKPIHTLLALRDTRTAVVDIGL